MSAVLGLAACGTGAQSTADPRQSGASATGPQSKDSGKSDAPAAKGGHLIVYEVTGKVGTADITYVDAGNKVKDVPGAALPWRMSVTVSGFLPLAIVTALADDGATVTCRITVDGKQVVQKSSTDNVSLVECDGDIP